MHFITFFLIKQNTGFHSKFLLTCVSNSFRIFSQLTTRPILPSHWSFLSPSTLQATFLKKKNLGSACEGICDICVWKGSLVEIGSHDPDWSLIRCAQG